MMGKSETIFEQVTRKSTLLDAWRIIRKKGKTGGIDGVSVNFYEKNFDRNIDTLLKSLQEGSYVPEPYERIHVGKEHKPGEYRPLSLPTINDKVVQQGLRQCLEAVFNPIFLDVSYAYRPGKGPAKAISRISHILQTEKIYWVACADIDRFFDAMDHGILLAELRKKVDEPEVSKLVRMWLKIGVVNPQGAYEETPFGIAQGGIISPLLSNIYLHPLDVYLTEKNYHYVRYADNFILLATSRREVEKSFEDSRYFLKEVLKLRLNRQKTYFHSRSLGFVFMGIFFKKDFKLIDRSRIERLESRLKFLVKSKLLLAPPIFFKRLEEKVRGFQNYYGKLVNPEVVYKSLNSFLSRTIAGTIAWDRLKKRSGPIKLK